MAEKLIAIVRWGAKLQSMLILEGEDPDSLVRQATESATGSKRDGLEVGLYRPAALTKKQAEIVQAAHEQAAALAAKTATRREGLAEENDARRERRRNARRAR